jgi:hypothetical protein
VFDKDGTLVVVTDRRDNGQAKDLLTAFIRSPGGEFTRQQLSDDSIVQSHVALDPRGGVDVVWMVGNAIEVARRPPGGSFSPAESVPTGLTNVFNAQMAIGPDGRETFVVQQFYTKNADTGHSRLIAFSRAGPGQALGAPQVVSPNAADTNDGRVGSFDLEVGPTGAAALAFEFQDTYPASFSASLRIARRAAANSAGVFATPQTLVLPAGDPSSEHVALDAAGRATIAFCSVEAGARRARVADAPADTGDFSAPVPLSPGAGNPNHNYAFLALAPDGAAVIGFGGGGAGAKYVTRRGPMPSTFDTPQQIDMAFPNAEPPEVAIGADDVAYAVLRSGSNVFSSDIDGWRSPAAGQPFARTRVATAAASGDAFEYGVGSDGAGNAVILYKGSVGSDNQRTLMFAPYDSVPPTVSLAAPASLVTGQAGDFTATGFDYWGPVSTTITYDDGGSGTPHAFATAGTHTSTATATDAAGLTATTTATTTVTLAPPPATRPGVTSFRVTNKVFAVGSAATVVSAAARKRGTTFQYKLSVDAAVTITIARKASGYEKAGKCVRKRPHKRKVVRCTRYLTAGALNRHGHAGANQVRFSGRIGPKALKPGGYRATIVATNAAGGSKPRTVAFKVVKG